jgi:hypothetical protein
MEVYPVLTNNVNKRTQPCWRVLVQGSMLLGTLIVIEALEWSTCHVGSNHQLKHGNVHAYVHCERNLSHVQRLLLMGTPIILFRGGGV